MSKTIASDVDCEFSVSDDGKSVVIRIHADVPVFAYKHGAQVIIDAVADSAMHYYSLSQEDWDEMADGGNGLDS